MTSIPLSTLYLCYFGLREPLVQTQVLPYLRELAKAGVKVHLLTFEPTIKTSWNADELQRKKEELQSAGITWHFMSYHKRPSIPATFYDVLLGALFARRLIIREKIDVLHARAHVAMAMALLTRSVKKCCLIFDIRGLIAEEYADAGVWTQNSIGFRLIKFVERAGIRRANQIVVLTNRMRHWLIERNLAEAEKIEVIPCCVDFSRFNHQPSAVTQHLTERLEVVYAGSVTGLYLLEEMATLFLHLQRERKDAFFRILTVSPASEAEVVLRRVGLREGDYWIGRVGAAEVPDYLQRAALGLSFRKATFSQIAASPTKIPEYLAAGLPVVCNAGVGDFDQLLKRERVGVVIDSFDPDSYARAATCALQLLTEKDLAARCTAAAKRYFDLSSVGGAGYDRVYRRLATPAEKQFADAV